MYEDASNSATRLTEELGNAKEQIRLLKDQLTEGLNAQRNLHMSEVKQWKQEAERAKQQLLFLELREQQVNDDIRRKAAEWDKHVEQDRRDTEFREKRWKEWDQRKQREGLVFESVSTNPTAQDSLSEELAELAAEANEASNTEQPVAANDQPRSSRRRAAATADATSQDILGKQINQHHVRSAEKRTYETQTDSIQTANPQVVSPSVFKGYIDVEGVDVGAVQPTCERRIQHMRTPRISVDGSSNLAMSSETPDSAGSAPNGRHSPVKMNPPTLEKIASRFNMPTSQRNEHAAISAESAGKSDTNSHIKISPMPSLSDIRARLNQRGVDVTSSKWSLKSTDKTPETAAPKESMGKDEASVKTVAEDVIQKPNKDPNPATEPTNTLEPNKPAQETEARPTEKTTLADSNPMSEADLKDSLEHTPVRHHGNSSKDQYEATLSRLEKNANYHLFKQGIKPMWEDPANANGGRWVITLRDRGQSAGSHAAHEALVDRTWMWLVLALIGDTLDDNDLVTGAVCSLRGKGDRITIWTRRKEPVDELNQLATHLLKLLELKDQPGIQVEFGVNSGSKESGYLKQHFAGKQPESVDGVAPPHEPALESWLESDYTLHPNDHMRYMAHRKSKNDEKEVV
ncbi:unnamed protein product [Malassezia sympodialis ATCC 42132]|uniref:uncharacterized protein n=1 Tax=Malassezia sympodialis (strain ATCC 42132) TaxID=1230383 RepID=UPI0002C1CCAC|nr:uncharacterized protein MSY001_2877 [Malassezia sympodialis ATCC 42132]CCV00172.1 unnamed protein product [Malassezia sympodialis ATCC 42132]|eukprot:XP_018741379.1 uncharacterized protein MSY001_2877 [Malassezia sympodialis ATCC 42132]